MKGINWSRRSCFQQDLLLGITDLGHKIPLNTHRTQR
uniref:Uncharacterized protein n=1 Tax=Rhizophora mucronata TaxID=61149 RepID=A0A2P2PCT0_RHIMU